MSESTFDQIKRQLDIREVYFDFAADPEETKTNVRCPIPDHPDHNPDASLYDHQNRWYCHACELGGSVIDLVMYTENVNCLQAAIRLNDRYNLGLSFDDETQEEFQQRQHRFDLLQEYIEECEQLLDEPQRQYLRERGLSDEFIEDIGHGFGIGYDPQEMPENRERAIQIGALKINQSDEEKPDFYRPGGGLVIPITNRFGKLTYYVCHHPDASSDYYSTDWVPEHARWKNEHMKYAKPGLQSVSDEAIQYLDDLRESEREILERHEELNSEMNQPLWGLNDVHGAENVKVVDGVFDKLPLDNCGFSSICNIGKSFPNDSVEQLKSLADKVDLDIQLIPDMSDNNPHKAVNDLASDLWPIEAEIMEFHDGMDVNDLRQECVSEEEFKNKVEQLDGQTLLDREFEELEQIDNEDQRIERVQKGPVCSLIAGKDELYHERYINEIADLLPGDKRKLKKKVRNLVEEAQQDDEETHEKQTATGGEIVKADDYTIQREADHLAEKLTKIEIPEEMKAPPGWNVSENGIFNESSVFELTINPVLITARMKEIATGNEFLEITFKDGSDDKWRSEVVPRENLFKGRELVELSRIGLGVNDNNVRDFIDYFQDFLNENQQAIPTQYITERLGWISNALDDGFIWGDYCLTPQTSISNGNILTTDTTRNAIQFHTDGGLGTVNKGFHTSGNFDDWKIIVEKLMPLPVFRTAIFGSFASPLLHILNLGNFTIDISGTGSTTGKTLAMKVAASVWGNPIPHDNPSIVQTWDNTSTNFERLASTQDNLPVFLDDTKKARYDSDIRTMIYKTESGQDRGRGDKGGGVREKKTWNSILFSTGEKKAIYFSQDAGLRARVISLPGYPFHDQSIRDRECSERAKLNNFASSLEDLMSHHYGHAGMRFIQYLIDNRDKKEEWEERIKQIEKQIGQRVNANAYQRRVAKFLSVIELAAELVREAGIIDWDYERVVPYQLEQKIMSHAAEADRSNDALEQVISWAQSNQSKFYDDTKEELDEPLEGWFGRWDKSAGLNITREKLQTFLERWDYDFKTILKQWQEKGILDTGSGRGLQKNVRIDGGQTKVYSIANETIDEVMGTEASDGDEDNIITGGNHDPFQSFVKITLSDNEANVPEKAQETSQDNDSVEQIDPQEEEPIDQDEDVASAQQVLDGMEHETTGGDDLCY